LDLSLSGAYYIGLILSRQSLFSLIDSVKKKQITKLLIQSGLIVFSVLFALFIDRMAENIKTNQQKNSALTKIQMELTENEKLIQKMITLHDEVIQRLNAAIKNPNDTIVLTIAADGYLDYHLLARGESLFPRYPSRTAWDAAKSTGIISEFDYETIEACEGVYGLQEMIVGNTLPKIVDDLFDLDSSQMNQKLIKFRSKFEEISNQERTLLHRLQEAIKRIE
jgi:hypothetical protein